MWVALLLGAVSVLAQPACTSILASANLNVCRRTFTMTGATPYALTQESGPGSNRYGLVRKFFALAGASQNFVVWQDSSLKIWATWVTGTTTTVAISAATTHNLIAVANNGDTIIYLIGSDAAATDGVTPLSMSIVKANALTGAESQRVAVNTAVGVLNIYDFSQTSHSGDMVWNVAGNSVGIVFSRVMTKGSDGLNHHGAIAVVFDATTLAIRNSLGQTSGHSFANNLILSSGGQFVGMDLGDNYPRGINGISFTTSLTTKVLYAYKTLHGTAANYCLQYNIACTLPEYPVYPEISTPTKTFYKWSNDNECYTELGHKGIIELSDSFMVVFAGENSPPLDSSKTGQSMNEARNLALLRVAKTSFPNSAVVSTGQSSSGGFYTFGGGWQPQSNSGIIWLTSYTALTDSVSRPKTARLGTNQNLITFELWSASTFQGSRVLMVNDLGAIVWGPVAVTPGTRLPQGDDLFVSGGKAYGYVGISGNLVQYEFSVPSAPTPCPSDSTSWGIFPVTQPGQTATLTCPPGYTGNVYRACSATGVWADPNATGCVAVPQPCPAPGPAPGGWATTAPGQTATKACPPGKSGTNTLQCSSAGVWGSEVNTCAFIANCSDGIQNQGETGVDCGCSTCTPACPACLVCGGIDCGLHGACVEPNPVCVCRDGWTGNRCEIAPANPCVGNPPQVDCGTHGACNQGVCTCFGNWTGSRCTVPPPATCTDGIKNSDEQGIDCGGATAMCPPCPNFVWTPNAFTACSLSCGGGTQTRTVDCVDTTTGNVAPAASCSGAHGFPTTQACNVDPCPVYTWVAGTYDPCSAPCGNGTQTRTVNCYSSAGNVIVTTGCDVALKPVAIQSCNTQACTAPHWESQPWTNCTASCGGGTQTRVVKCLTAADVVTADTDCTATKPPTSQACNVDSCERYNWLACPSFYPCTAQCNGGGAMVGNQYRDVFCLRDSDSAPVDASLCNSSSKPTILLSVCNTQPCTNYNWMADSNWGPCTMQDNGFFQRTRTFHCHASDGTTALREKCVAEAGKLPIAVLPCTPGTCASAEGCPIVEIADMFNQCDINTIRTCRATASCGIAARLFDRQMEALGFGARTPAALKCIVDYVTSLAPADKPTTEILTYVNGQLTAGKTVCGAGLSESAASYLSPLSGLILAAFFVF